MNRTDTAPISSPLATPVAGTCNPSSYGDIVKSSSIIGGAQGGTLLIGMVQTKLVAILLGPSGVGLVGLYQSATGLIGTVSGFGIGQSAVREVSEAHTSGNLGRVARTVIVLRRACWATGLLGWLMTAVLSWPLSVWTFGTPERAVPIALLGATLLLTSISAGQRALVQGARRIGDLARLQLLPTIPSLAISVSLYAWLGESGIVPVLIIVGGVNLAFSWWIARRVPLVVATITWRESLRESGRFVSLGLAFAWSGLMAAGVELATRAWIVRDYGTEANGIYQSAWTISGVFAGFILQAMAADFYPRLSSMAKNNAEVNRLVNEQTEVGILLALPGILATLLFAPWAKSLLYTPKFMAASELLPWFVLGVFAKVVSWPLAFIQQAKGASRMFAATETISWALLLVLTWLGLYWWQVPGVAIAFAILQGMYVLGMRYVAGLLSGFRWSSPVRWLLLLSAAAVSVTVAIATQLPPLMASASGGLLVLLASGLCLLRLKVRLGPSHKLSIFIARFYKSRLGRKI